MYFTKSGDEVRIQLQGLIDDNRQQLEKVQEYFEREKEKSALQRIRELELEIERFRRILNHLRPEKDYQLTEQDLIDFRW